MGKTCCRIVEKHWWESLEAADWIAISAILVNGLIAFLVIKTIQNRVTNKRVLKDHFITELKQLRDEYKSCLANLYGDKVHAKKMAPWFKLMTIKTSDLLDFLNSKYKINKTALTKYHRDFRELVTNNNDYISQYGSQNPVVFSEESKRKLIQFQQDNNKIFNELIIKVNDAD